MKIKLTFLGVMFMMALLLIPGVASTEEPPVGSSESIEFCTPEQLETDRDNCPGTWASSADMIPEHRESAVNDNGVAPSDIQAFIGCNFQTRSDNPHESSSPSGYVSVHGWWNDRSNSDNPCPVYADVTVRLMGYWCWIPGIDCEWRVLHSNEERVRADNKPGGRKVNAREPCATNTTTMYLSVVDVDLVDMVDLPNVAQAVANVNCRPAD